MVDDCKKFIERYKDIIGRVKGGKCDYYPMEKKYVIYYEVSLMLLDQTECNNKKLYNSVDDVLQCVICIDDYRSYMVTPCNHLCLCKKCSTDIKTCPICRYNVISIIRVFI